LALNRAYIAEDLDLAGCTIPQPLSFSGCLFARSVLLQDSAAKSLSFSGSRVQAFNAQGATVQGGLFAEAGFRSDGGVSFVYGTVEGGLSLMGGVFLAGAGPAIDLTGTRVTGDVRLGGDFLAEGSVTLSGANIGGAFRCQGGVFGNRKEDGTGIALACDHAAIARDVQLSDGFRAEGAVSFSSARIGGTLNCRSGTFSNPTSEGRGEALNCAYAEIGESVLLNDGFTAKGKVRFTGVHIGANFQISRGRFDNAAVAQSDGSPPWTPRSATAINLRGATIDGVLWLGPHRGNERAEISGSLNLLGCHAREIVDHPNSWPGESIVSYGLELPAHIYLDGFTYSYLGRGDYGANTRKRWLDRQPPRHLGLEFRPQPFEQLTKVYRAMGHERHAREVAKFKERRRYRSRFIKLWHGWRARPQFMRRTFGRNYLTSFLDWLDWLPVIGERLIYRSLVSVLYALEWFIIGTGTAYGYGYARLIAFLLTLWMAGGVFYGCAANNGAFGPSNPVIYLNKELEAKCGKNWTACKGAPRELPGFDPFTYSADAALA
jgi:hypothetical protein